MRENNLGVKSRSIPTCANLTTFTTMMNNIDRVTSDSGANFVKMIVVNPGFLEKATLSDQEVARVFRTLFLKGASRKAAWEASVASGHYETLLALDVPNDVSRAEIVSWFMSGVDKRADRTSSSLDEDKIKKVLIKLSKLSPNADQRNVTGGREHPLYIAMKRGWLGVTKQLLDMGSDPNAPTNSRSDTRTRTVIDTACARGHTKMVNLMINRKVCHLCGGALRID